ncbi:Arginine-tRNA-protein transferase [hydrothermal vent metagenome]|uniref:Arginine-tRNA-protein transferase n=1 Tax=hydrothermal vent metagenome TaxID=652676 RepID=A0A1W1CZD1_9ZZZZ
MQNKNDLDLLIPKSIDFTHDDHPCAYIPNKRMKMNYKQVEMVSKTFATAVAQRGWRRFGKSFIYPLCYGCTECKSLRIDVSNYKYSKSQRKAINRNEKTKISIQEPSMRKEHIALYNKYHAYKAKRDGWNHQDISMQEYYENFIDGAHDFGKELLYYIDDKLVCVDLIDILDDGISAVYCYYDPDYPRFSLGTYSLLYQIKLAENLGLDWVYLGYWIEGNKAFEYKENFEPLEILEGYPRVVEKPKWKKWSERKPSELRL